MSFFDRNRKSLAEKGIDPSRLPPGQYSTDRFPVLHVGEVPDFDPATWTLDVTGNVESPFTLTWDELQAMDAVDITTDIHCVTKWSKFDTVWTGVRLRDLLDRAEMKPDTRHLIMHAEYGYTANVPIAEALGDKCLLAYQHDGKPLDPEHGQPARTLIPALYLWKSVKWIRALEASITDQPGFWETRGYHNFGDPFREQRFTND